MNWNAGYITLELEENIITGGTAVHSQGGNGPTVSAIGACGQLHILLHGGQHILRLVCDRLQRGADDMVTPRAAR